MRALGQPEVIRKSAIAAAATSLACFPRLLHPPQIHYPTWYLEALIFLGSMVLWGFVFAWLPIYARRPAFDFKLPPWLWILATALGVLCGALLQLFLDPVLRTRTPADYPVNFTQWIAMLFFSLSFTQLFLVFAPFAWLLRLFKRLEPAVVLTVAFGIFVLVLKNHRAPTPMPNALLAGLLLFRILGGFFAVFLFIRGGVLLVWWWTFLIQCRHLVALFF